MEIIVKVTQVELDDMGLDDYDLENEIFDRLNHKHPYLSGFNVNAEVID